MSKFSKESFNKSLGYSKDAFSYVENILKLKELLSKIQSNLDEDLRNKLTPIRIFIGSIDGGSNGSNECIPVK
jgi:hypothetical protein|tara:strand:- start:336 stop:554 length:219 start_codon:yes stop_codon:yes gene_type:complete